MKNAPISEYMTPMPHTVGRDQTISFAQEVLVEHGFRHLPVLHGGRLVGVVSDRDLGLVAGLNDVNPDTTPVEEAMTQFLYQVGPQELLSTVLAEMEEHKYGSALVVEGNEVVGIFTTHDAVALLRKALSDDS